MDSSSLRWPHRKYRSRIPRFNLQNTRARFRTWSGFGQTSFGYTVGQSFAAGPIRLPFIQGIACPRQLIFEGNAEHFKSKSAEPFAHISEQGKFKGRPYIRTGEKESLELIQGIMSDSML